jgi:peptide chain release factor subunit 1
VELQVGARHSGHGFEEVQGAIEAELLKRRLAVIDDAAQRFAAEVGRQSGLAAEGLGPVCSGLRQGAVDTLIIGDIGEMTCEEDPLGTDAR